MFESVLVANRGEIARRVTRTARAIGVRTVAVYSETDERLPHVQEADIAVALGGISSADSYLRIDKILAAAAETGASAIHPGYGFLAENADFARAVLAADLIWIGPSPESMTAMGDKVNARNLVSAAGVAVSRGTREPVSSAEECLFYVREIGYPIMVKAASGGGGIGMGVAHDDASLLAAFDTARSRGERFFGSSSILLEEYIPAARHVEVQILGLADGRVIALGERDCSVQRRHQKVAEETPSPGVGNDLRVRLLRDAVRAGEAVGYKNAGTVECLVDPVKQEYVFLEMNTRLQVEHPITELTTGIDIVEQQFRIAAGDTVTFDVDNIRREGHAIELRVYAEDPTRYLPSPGRITRYEEPTGDGVRVDSGYSAGDDVTINFDPLIAKLCVSAPTRAEAIERGCRAVDEFIIEGPKTNLRLFAQLLRDERFVAGDYHTGILDNFQPRPASVAGLGG